MMTVIAKTTLSFATERPGVLPFAEEQLGLALDLPSELDGAEEGEIAYPSDFVPMKPAIEILLHGHAYSDRPELRHPASVEIESVARAFVVETAAPSVRAPLVARSIRSPNGLEGAPPTGPRRALATPGTSARGTLHAPFTHAEGFNFIEYAVGPESQRMKSPPAGWTLTLRGLSARASKRVVALPDIAPVVWLDTAAQRGAELEMWCDTVWIDTDRELCVMVWRGVVETPSLEDDGVERILLSLARGDEAPALSEVRRDLARSAFEPAVEIDDFDDESARELAADEATFAQYETWDEAVEPSISLEAYASIAAASAEGGEARASALAARGLDEKGFGVEERAWLIKLGDLAQHGETGPAVRFGELFLTAQDALQGPGEGGETAEAYAALKVDLDRASDTIELLAARRMTLAQWMRMDRRWQRRAAEDRGLRERIDRSMRTYRARLARETESPAPGASTRGGTE
jgi:hypothetical protein